MILYFSGTGNSAHAAKRIGACLEDEVVNLFDRIRSGDHSPMESARPWVVVTPTYAWRIPRVVSEWLLSASLRGSREIYFVVTCGDSSGDAGRFARKLCGKMGMTFRGCASVKMPENYIAMFEAPQEQTARALVLRAGRRLDELAGAIAVGADLPAGRVTAVGRICSAVVNPVFCRVIVKDRKFRATDECVLCGKCEQVCPLGNIRLANGRPTWNGRCTHCMACICRCPKAAIEYGRASQGKVRYTCPEE